ASTAAEFQKILNGQHTITIEVNDGTETAAFTATFTKVVRAATITLETPMAVEGDITVARLAVTGNIPADAEYSVKVTNNGNDTEPVWPDCTVEVKSEIGRASCRERVKTKEHEKSVARCEVSRM